MCRSKFWIVLTLLLFGVCFAHSQERRTEINVDFRVSSVVIDSAYLDNAAQMKIMKNFIQELRQDSTITLTHVSFCGVASPEGHDNLNRKLARGRLGALERLVRREVEIPDSIISYNDNYINWDYLKSNIEASDISFKAEVLQILEEHDDSNHSLHSTPEVDPRIAKLRQLDYGRVWLQIYQRYFARMRNAYAIFVTYKQEPPIVEPEPEPTPYPAPVPEVVTPEPEVVEPDPVQAPEPECWVPHIYLKSNLLGLSVAIANLAVEVDLAKHVSFSLPIYYSGWNYFTSPIKFRAFATQPEVRFWTSKENDGFFTGVHFGMAYYNLATNGQYRYQDHRRETPALGGGVSVGYRLPVSKNNRWKMEFSLGAGAYKLHYDKFYNTDRTSDGLMKESVVRNYYGIDQATVSIAYMFDLKKKGGKR